MYTKGRRDKTMKKIVALLLCGIMMMTAWACAEEGAQQEAADGISDALLGSMIAGAQESAQEAEVEEAKADYRHITRMYENWEAYAGQRLDGLYFVCGDTLSVGEGSYLSLFTPVEGEAGELIVACQSEEDWKLEYGEYVYVSGIFQDAVSLGLMGDDGMVYADAVLVEGNKLERFFRETTAREEETWTLDPQKAAAEQGGLRIEVVNLSFMADGMMTLLTKTQDKSVTEYQDYYVDVMVHQGDRVVFLSNCNFWINPGIAGYDQLPFPALDSTQPMTAEFWVYDAEGERLYDPLVIELQPAQ